MALAAGLVVLYPLSRANYLLFHALVESFAVAVASGIFIIAWNTRRIAASRYLLTLGVAHLFVAFVTLLHAFAYKGMGIFPGAGANLPAQLWIIERVLEALAFVVAAVAIRREIPVGVTFASFGALTVISLAAIWVRPVFPTMYVDGTGLTATKIFSEYAIVGLFAMGLALLWRERSRFEPGVTRLLVSAISLMIAADLAFTLYTDVYGALNFLGHYLVLIGYVLVYRALIRTALREPYSLLFHELKQREETEHHIAERLQTAILAAPERVDDVEMGHAHVSATRSARVSGDFWDLFAPQPGRVAFVLGDVCGKGIDAAATTVMARAVIRSFSYADPDPSAVLCNTNVALGRQLADDKFVTAVYGVIDVSSGEVIVASAGHYAPIACRAGVSASLGLPSNPPLGVTHGHSYQSGACVLDKGDSLVLFSDGLVEAGWESEMLGVDRVVEHVGNGQHHVPRVLAESLLESAMTHAGGAINDDVAVVVLRLVNGALA